MQNEIVLWSRFLDAFYLLSVITTAGFSPWHLYSGTNGVVHSEPEKTKYSSEFLLYFRVLNDVGPAKYHRLPLNLVQLFYEANVYIWLPIYALKKFNDFEKKLCPKKWTLRQKYKCVSVVLRAFSMLCWIKIAQWQRNNEEILGHFFELMYFLPVKR